MSKTSTQNSISYKGTKIWSKLKSELKNLHWNALKKQLKKALLINSKFLNILFPNILVHVM